MKVKPTIAIAAMVTLPLAAYFGRQKLEERTLPPQAGFVQPFNGIAPAPFIRPVVPAEDIDNFFHVKRDSEKGFIYLQPHESTEGIARHLMDHHGAQLGDAIDAIEAVDRVTKQFNEKASTLEQVEISFQSLLKKERADGGLIERGPFNPKANNPKIEMPVMPLLVPGLRDYIDSMEKHIELTQSDGLVSPISVLPTALDSMTEHGFPFSLYLKDGMDVVPGSEKLVMYLDKRYGVVRKAPLVEISEPAGRFGKGGVNGVIITGPTIIITNKKMYLFNFDMHGGIKTEKFDSENQVPKRDFKRLLHLSDAFIEV